MRRLRLLLMIMIVTIGLLLVVALAIPQTANAQDVDVGTPPVVITPGAPIRNQFDITPDPTLSFNDCFTPFVLSPGDLIFIEPGVNIRRSGDFSSPIVWNTSYQQRDEEGNRLVPEEEFNVQAFVVAGPVCSNGYNWWQVNISGGIDGWVAEGRPTDPGGYLILRNPGEPIFEEDINCTPVFPLNANQVARVTQNVRVRAEPNRDGRVVTVVPARSNVRILEGPECNAQDGLQWFRVEATVVDFTYTGWMSQGAGGAVWLIPRNLPNERAGTLCVAPQPFTIGQLGYVNSFDEGARYLRERPGTNSEIQFLLVDGVPFEFIGGPVCRNNLNWWRIRVRSSNPVEGWIAEGSPHVGVWLSPTDPNEYSR